MTAREWDALTKKPFVNRGDIEFARPRLKETGFSVRALPRGGFEIRPDGEQGIAIDGPEVRRLRDFLNTTFPPQEDGE